MMYRVGLSFFKNKKEVAITKMEARTKYFLFI